jgi:RNA polymerase sigma-70 factor (ECF subfamily)
MPSRTNPVAEAARTGSPPKGPRPADEWTALLLRGQAGDQEALNLVLGEALPWLHRLAQAALRNDADSWDVAQTAVLRLLRHLPSFNPTKAGAKSYLAHITRNLVVDVIRSRARCRPCGSVSERSELPENRRGPDFEAEAREGLAEVRQALLRVRPNYRQAVALRYYEGKSYREIARDLGAPLGTVANWVARGLEHLRKELRAKALRARAG